MNDTEFSNLRLNTVKSANFELCSTGSGSDFLIYVVSVLMCYAFVRVCLLMPCGHLLGKG